MGIIVLMGGDEFRQGCQLMDREILSRIAHQPPRVLILPTAAALEDPHLAAQNGIHYFTALGAEATAAMILSRSDADDPLHAAQLREADLVYLTGGNPWHLLQSLANSAVWAAIKDLWRGGRTIAGSSAGAMVLGERMRTRSSGWTPALGLAPRVAVLPHYQRSQDESVKALRSAPEPEHVLLGIPTATACINYVDNTWWIAGNGEVAVFSGTEVYRYGPGQCFELP